MRRASLALALAFLAHEVTAADPSRGDVGGWDVANIPSPNGVYRITTRPYDGSNDESTTLVLQHGARKRVLAKFVRTGDVIWSPDSRFVIFVDKHSPLEHTIKIFHIGNRVTEMKWIDRVILQAVESRTPRYQIENYMFNSARFEADSILLLENEVDFLPSGAPEGPMQGVTTLFKVDLNALKVSQLRREPAN
jgi:hypothetical protein